LRHHHLHPRLTHLEELVNESKGTTTSPNGWEVNPYKPKPAISSDLPLSTSNPFETRNHADDEVHTLEGQDSNEVKDDELDICADEDDKPFEKPLDDLGLETGQTENRRSSNIFDYPPSPSSIFSDPHSSSTDIYIHPQIRKPLRSSTTSFELFSLT
jgi:hypothetical protein